MTLLRPPGTPKIRKNLPIFRDEELSILGKIRDYITSRMGVAEEFIML